MIDAIRRKVFNHYSKLSKSNRNYLSKILEKIPKKYIYGKNFFETFSYLKKTEYLSKGKIKNIQIEKLKKILEHAFNSTKFYRNEMMYKGLNSSNIKVDPLNVLSKMNFIDKSIIREEEAQIISNKKKWIPYDNCSTGGTSGEPLYFICNSDRSVKELAFIFDMWSRIGFNFDSKRITFRGGKIDTIGWDDDIITKERKFSSFEMTEQYLKNIWPLIDDYSPDFVYAYPSTAITICKFMENNQKVLPKTIKAFLLGSENIYKNQREYIEKISNKKIFLWYGHSEKLVLAGECEKSNIYHAYPQYGYTEFINKEGNHAKPGEIAEIVGTGFLNTVMPFIRYRTGDYCIYLGEKCLECGRNYPIFSDVVGRWTQEILYGYKGNEICMSAINLHSDAMKNVFRFQFFQNRPGETILKIIPKEGFSYKDTKIIEKEFNEKFGGNIRTRVKIVKKIPLTKIGKYKYIDQQTKNEKLN